MQMNATLCFHFLKREISWLHTKLPLSDGGVAFVSTTQNQVLHVFLFPPHKNSIFADEIIIIQTFLCSFLLFGWVRWKKRRFQLGIWMNYFILKDFRFKKNWRKYAFSVISLWRFTVFLSVLWIRMFTFSYICRLSTFLKQTSLFDLKRSNTRRKKN